MLRRPLRHLQWVRQRRPEHRRSQLLLRAVALVYNIGLLLLWIVRWRIL